jgi:hypothetical protein
MHSLVKSLIFLLLIAPALAFDSAGFGDRLNGWTRDGSARYSLDGVDYRTLRPVVTANGDGGETVAVTVLHRANSWAEVPFQLEVSFGADGTAESFRIHGTPRGQKVDTGLVTRPSPPAAPAAVEGQPAPPAPPFRPLAEMTRALFESFDSQVATAAEAEDTRKRDLLARIYGPEPIDPAALARGLRYNLDLILRNPASTK